MWCRRSARHHVWSHPKLVLPAIQQKSLRWSDRGVAASVSPTVATPPPAAYASSITPSPYRGYVMAGYFPAFQLGVSAGYKLIKTDNSDLNVWMQYDGSSVKRKARSTAERKSAIILLTKARQHIIPRMLVSALAVRIPLRMSVRCRAVWPTTSHRITFRH